MTSSRPPSEVFDRYNIVSEKNLSEALMKRAIYEATLTKAPTKRGATLEFRGTKQSTTGR